jgi:hypothetical protein
VWVLFNDVERSWDYIESGLDEWNVSMERWWKESAKRAPKYWVSLLHCYLYTMDFTWTGLQSVWKCHRRTSEVNFNIKHNLFFFWCEGHGL